MDVRVNMITLCYICLIVLINRQSLVYCVYQIPKATFTTSANGFSLSIPDQNGIQNVAFNININRAFGAFEQGHISRQLKSPNNGQWTLTLNQILDNEDIVYAWTSVQYQNSVYTRPADQFSVHTKNAEADYMDFEKGDSNVNKNCKPSATIVSRGMRRICAGDLIFADDFNSDDLKESLWTSETHFASILGDGEFVLYHKSNVALDNGYLRLKANLFRDKYPNICARGSLSLNDSCESYELENECARRAQGQFVLPSVVAGRINTKTKFSFKYGRIEVRAQLPQGDWLIPLILLDPLVKTNGEAYGSGQIRVAFARGNEELNDIDGRKVYSGAVFSANAGLRHRYMAETIANDHFGKNFHRYSLIWTNESIIMELDGRKYGRIESDTFPRPLNQELYVVLGIAAGGHGDFPEGVGSKPWRNTSPKATYEFGKNLETWYPTWKHPELKVDYIKIYAI